MNHKMALHYKWAFEQIRLAATKPLQLNLQFFAAGDPETSFGLADITLYDEEVEFMKLDGSTILQADGGEVNITPSYKDINFKDTGDTVDEKRLGGWAGTVMFVVGQDDLRLFQLQLSSVDAVVDSVSSDVVGYTDSKIGTKLKSYKVVIHPRIFPTSDKRFDITIYQMASTGGIVKPYNDEHTKMTITLEMQPRKGLDASKGANFFYTGPIDPNAAV